MKNLIADIKQDTINTAFITGVKQIDERVLNAFESVDRRDFVLPEDRMHAFMNKPLDIGYGQTISQPFVVALITHLIEPKISDKVLEIGSGSGYQVAILSKLCREVFGIEYIQKLADRSVQVLQKAKIKNATIICGDGNLGLPEHAPFDKIIVSAAANKLPQLLLDQLNVGGILVFPKSLSPYEQMLIRITKTAHTKFNMRDILPVRFVPLVNS
jgi:protein-L-isoaspartate(D-aspartate) O-methyltransferase